MTPTEIVRQDAIREDYDADIVLRKMSKLLSAKGALLLQSNNSLLLLIGLPDNDAELHLYTADSPLTLAKSLKEFVQKIRDSEVETVYGSAEIPQTLELLKRLGVDVQPSDKKGYYWMAPANQIEGNI
jgi:hypothetical protein